MVSGVVAGMKDVVRSVLVMHRLAAAPSRGSRCVGIRSGGEASCLGAWEVMEEAAV